MKNVVDIEARDFAFTLKGKRFSWGSFYNDDGLWESVSFTCGRREYTRFITCSTQNEAERWAAYFALIAGDIDLKTFQESLHKNIKQ